MIGFNDFNVIFINRLCIGKILYKIYDRIFGICYIEVKKLV